VDYDFEFIEVVYGFEVTMNFVWQSLPLSLAVLYLVFHKKLTWTSFTY